MIRFEDIADDARQFLQGRMSQQEAIDFVRLLDRHPHLKSDFEIMEKMVSVMQEIPEQELRDRLNATQSEKASGKLHAKFLHKIWIFVFAVFLISILLWSTFQNRIDTPGQIPSDKKGISTYTGSEKNGLFANTATDLAIGPEGQLYIGGNFYREIDFGSITVTGDTGSLDFFLLQMTPELKVEWVKSYGGPGDDYLSRIIVDEQSNVIFSGRIGDTARFDEVQLIPKSKQHKDGTSDLFIAKMDQKREVIWAVNDGDKNIPYVSSGVGTINGLSVDKRHNIYAVGGIWAKTIWSYPIDQTKAANAFIVKLSPEGQIRWLQSLTGEYGVRLHGIDISDDMLFVTGSFGHRALGGDLILGDSIITGFGDTDIIIAKYDLNGKLLWGQVAGSSGSSFDDGAYDVKYSSDDAIHITGHFSDNMSFGDHKLFSNQGRDFYLASMDTDGGIIWIVQGGGGTQLSKNTDLDMGAALDVDAAGNSYVCGIFAENAVFGKDTLHPKGIQDLFVAKYNSRGDLQWIKPFGGDSEEVNMERAMDIVVNNDGDCYVTGYFSGDLFIDDHRLEAGGQLNIFILALDSSGRIKQFDKLLFASINKVDNPPI